MNSQKLRHVRLSPADFELAWSLRGGRDRYGDRLKENCRAVLVDGKLAKEFHYGKPEVVKASIETYEQLFEERG